MTGHMGARPRRFIILVHTRSSSERRSALYIPSAQGGVENMVTLIIVGQKRKQLGTAQPYVLPLTVTLQAQEPIRLSTFRNSPSPSR